jgi:nitrile hydratase
LPPKLYDTLTYYEKWIASLTNIMVEKGVLTRAEIEQRMAAIRSARTEEAS